MLFLFADPIGKGRTVNLSLKAKLVALFLLVGVLPFAITGILALWKSSTALEDQATNQLLSVRDIKAEQLRRFFQDRRGDMSVLVETVGTLRQEAGNKLRAVREIKRQAVERYFQSIRDQIVTFSENEMVVNAMGEFRQSFGRFREENQIEQAAIGQMRDKLATYYTGEFTREYKKINQGTDPNAIQFLNRLDDDSIALQYHFIRANQHPLGSKDNLDTPGDASGYSKTHARVHPVIRDYLRKFGYYDIFLVDLESGDIVYSVFKELDYSTSLIDGPFAKTNFGECFRRAKAAGQKDAIILVDYAQYTPSYEAPASFVASPIYNGQEMIGVAMFQMPIERLNEIMRERAGLGSTGQTYLVGADGLMRSDSPLENAEAGPVLRSVDASFRRPETGQVRTETWSGAQEGKTGAEVIVDYKSDRVLSAFAPVELGDFRWSLLAEIDINEAFCPKLASSEKDFFTRYKEQYGYYDLFLINPDGFCFYTVEHEADYHTNLVNGKYADSGLGRLVRRVLQSKSFEMEDFAPYAPSNGDPAAFIAEPVLNARGEVELIVALQLSLDSINAVMKSREGMGQTGQTYLVGADKRMRSDSPLHGQTHTVAASFAGNVGENGADTDAVNAALAGRTEHEITTSYNGHDVLAAYAPVDIYGTRWALVAEKDTSEALAAVSMIKWMLGVIAIVGVAGICVVALLVANSIAKPINRIIGSLSAGSEQTAAAASRVSSASQSLAEGAGRQASSLQQTSANIEQMLEMIKRNAANSNEARQIATKARDAADTGTENMEQMTRAIDDIKTSSDETGKIVRTIDEIAFQTNLLALNAAVEAARAGEAGKGFAVVAEEVRNLAQRSAEAARNTADLIEGAVQNADNGVEITQRVAASLSEIAEGNRKLNDLVEQIAQASNQQAEGIEEISQAVTEVDSVTQTNSSNAEESAAASEELSAQAGQLQTMVSDMQGIVGGRRDQCESTGTGHQPQLQPDRPGRQRSQQQDQGELADAVQPQADWKADEKIESF